MQRRTFLHATAAATVTATLPAAVAAAAANRGSRIKLGIDNFAVRGLGWKAPALIDYAASIKCDTLFISDLDTLESLDEQNLRAIKARADAAGLGLYVGGWSICPTSKSFKKNWGSAEEHLRLGIRVARTLGSPVYRVILGNSEDRKSEGGIQARIKDTVSVLKACRGAARDAGVKIALENHSGDLHSWEARQLIEDAGTDFVGANIDSGNALWTLEDPMDVLETLGPVTICSSLRDGMVWPSPEGATVQWTAAGDGLIDWKKWALRWRDLCPKVPIMIETISGGQRIFAYKNPAFWQHYDRRPDKLAKFEALARRGRPLEKTPNVQTPEGRQSQQQYQKAEVEKSIAYLRKEIGLGVRT